MTTLVEILSKFIFLFLVKIEITGSLTLTSKFQEKYQTMNSLMSLLFVSFCWSCLLEIQCIICILQTVDLVNSFLYIFCIALLITGHCYVVKVREGEVKSVRDNLHVVFSVEFSWFLNFFQNQLNYFLHYIGNYFSFPIKVFLAI